MKKKPNKRNSKYCVNHDFFKKWSSNMAYILGFWFADGWIDDNNKLGIIQHKNDKYILDEILKSMESSHKLYKNKCNNCYTLQISSKKIVDDIKFIGGKPRKSLTVEFPNVPKKYLPDFIRGLWDGDGCISYSKTKGCYVSCFVSGSELFIKKFHFTIKKEIHGLNGSIHKRQNKNPLYTLMLGRNDTIRLREYMYGCKPKLMLIRKYKKFQLTGNIKKIGRTNRKYLSFCDARSIICKEYIKTVSEWREYSRTKRPINIPSMPQQYYKNNGWTNFYDFLGKVKVVKT